MLNGWINTKFAIFLKGFVPAFTILKLTNMNFTFYKIEEYFSLNTLRSQHTDIYSCDPFKEASPTRTNPAVNKSFRFCFFLYQRSRVREMCGNICKVSCLNSSEILLKTFHDLILQYIYLCHCESFMEPSFACTMSLVNSYIILKYNWRIMITFPGKNFPQY